MLTRIMSRVMDLTDITRLHTCIHYIQPFSDSPSTSENLSTNKVVFKFIFSVIAAKDINVTLEITSESCKNGKYNQSAMLSKRLNETVRPMKLV